jgi:hypothetical protein
MMFVGDKGRIVAQFRGEKPVLIVNDKIVPETGTVVKPNEQNRDEAWINAFRNKTESPGSFVYAGPVTETILLGAVALRAGKMVEYDSANMKITNVPEANKYLTREYRTGWEL